MRGICDQALLLDGLHVIVVGTTDAVRTVVQRPTQVRPRCSATPLCWTRWRCPKSIHSWNTAIRPSNWDPGKSWCHRLRTPWWSNCMASSVGIPRGMLKNLEDGLQDLLGLTPVGDEVRPIAGTTRLAV